MTSLTPSEKQLNVWLKDFQVMFANPFHQQWLHEPIRLDIYDEGDHFSIEAEVSGVPKKQLKVEVEETRVIISGTLKPKNGVGGHSTLLHDERQLGLISRTVRLPSRVNPSTAAAKYEDGLLTVRIQKQAELAKAAVDIM
jgi:HSP20 family protein